MARVGHVIYKRCTKGDRLKVEAKAQKAGTGSGALDVRFNPLRLFEEAIPEVFSDTGTDPRGPFNSAPVHWWDAGKMQGPQTVKIRPPYNTRKELRLSLVYKVTPFDEHHIPPHKLDPFFLIWQDEERVWAKYVTVEDMRLPGWPRALVGPILDSVKTAPPDQNIRGWINLETGEGEHRDAR
jgi:hypothetical protein